ncbi:MULTISPECIES: MipA/OmpV family protein [unclassified Undibacterium]|uniref:MipA/OmpV family protein n=1 Tax=unclassified Undibacterium TaxID=2630295 RepID=UPI002AC9BB68|nr:MULTISPECIES: MipA/OmpV family protein [unclassified Undibacterium]MEB0138767.1 MipA/OmpV family protein [Undibacterium sp. CCC2.1]MEB0170757.1 MipA/OmpV family protein [Undibacterium sp. CCC1.1]MEB0174646.1 MipA/OmpV family protein [Undibacterium sp. CCC3.4]MEB0213843.1 MipA/OmpV family protein [Undibacterium sp. 5I2]WPX42569.1 MipA/OmpV family protein [Undibacterium sp. CCC3.4]
MTIYFRLALAAAALTLSAAASAQTSQFVQTIPEYYLPKDFNYSLGAAAIFMPSYQGSNERRKAVYPLFDAHWKNGFFLSTVNGLGYNFSKSGNLQYGLRMSLEGARDVSRSSKLQGLGDVATTIEPGAFANYHINQNYSLLTSLRYGSGVDHNGLQVSFGARATTELNDKHRLTATVSANWANSQYMQSYFGVNATQSQASGYTPYTPSAGLTDVKLGTSWHWTIDTNWSLTTGATISRYSNDVSKSPFVFQNSPVVVYSAASYRF